MRCYSELFQLGRLVGWERGGVLSLGASGPGSGNARRFGGSGELVTHIAPPVRSHARSPVRNLRRASEDKRPPSGSAVKSPAATTKRGMTSCIRRAQQSVSHATPTPLPWSWVLPPLTRSLLVRDQSDRAYHLPGPAHRHRSRLRPSALCPPHWPLVIPLGLRCMHT